VDNGNVKEENIKADRGAKNRDDETTVAPK